MASRERLVSGRAPEAAQRMPRGSATVPSVSASALPESADASWDAILRDAPADLQKALLALARRQGFLYAHQLPDGRNGTPKDKPNLPEAIGYILDGTTTDLEPVQTSPVSTSDAHLDSAQREAVAKALATPDLCLIRGLPGTGKSRVGAEIVSQAIAKGERVLLVAAAPPANDRILEMLPGDAICAVRCLEPGQRVECLPAKIRKWSVAEQVQRLESSGLASARDELARQEQRERRIRQDEPVWATLTEIASQTGALRSQAADLAHARSHVAEQIQGEIEWARGENADPQSDFQLAIRDCLAATRNQCGEMDRMLTDVRQRLEKCRTEGDGIVPTLGTLDRLMAARRSWRIWTSDWWRAFRRNDLESEFQKTEERARNISAEAARLEAEIDRLTTEQSDTRTRGDTELRDHCQQEIQHREAEIDRQLSALNVELDSWHAKWRAALETLAPETEKPSAISADAVRQASARRAEQMQHAERLGVFLSRWIAFLEESPPWATLLPSSANLVAATPSALAVDPQFGGESAHGRGFDLLVLQEADQFGEAEFRSLAARARRCVLVGEASFHKPAIASAPAKHASQTAQAPEAFFNRLWQRLHWEPRGLPYAWFREGDHLCCRLRPVSAESRAHLESERLADYPDIELRILARPRMEPLLAEVVFPRSFSIAEAKAFIFRELDELAVHSNSTSTRWSEDAGRIRFHLTDDCRSHTDAVVLEAGVRECVGPALCGVNGAGAGHWQTCCVEFDQAAGWDRPRAEDWIRRRLGGRDLGRTARLDVPHRMQRGLAEWVSDVACGGEYGPVQTVHRQQDIGATVASNRHIADVEFVAVPPMRGSRSMSGRPSEKASASRLSSTSSSHKGGAGLEIDLTDPRHRSRLPGAVNCDLPARGFVNYIEAEAVVRTLENLVTSAPADPAPAVAVLALYQAQVNLIRLLVQRSPVLQSAPIEIVIDLPSEVREREFGIVLVSLTRSHSHRPVTYGDSPALLTVALTRARDRLILFGDPGSLGRRSQWDGPLDHLNEMLAARERDVLARMFDYVLGRGSTRDGFVLREGANP